MPFSSGKYYPETALGNTFIGSTAVAGIKPSEDDATAIKFALWNPRGSGKNLVVNTLAAGFVDTTSAAGNIGLSYQAGVGSQAATGGAVTAVTAVAPVNAKLGDGNSSVSIFAPATLTLASGAAWLMAIGWNQLVTTAATTTAPGWDWYRDFDGSLIIPPDVLIAVTGPTAPLSNLNITINWTEVPE